MVHACKIYVVDHLQNWWWQKYFCQHQQAMSHLGKWDVSVTCAVSGMQHGVQDSASLLTLVLVCLGTGEG